MNLPRRQRHEQDINRYDQEVNRSHLNAAIPLGLLAAAALGYYLSKRADAERAQFYMGTSRRGIHLNGSVNIDRSAEEIYNFWRSFVQLPQVMTFLDRVDDIGAGLTHWVIEGPKNSTIEWDSEVINDQPNERISWQSIPGSDMHTWGEVQFQDDSRGRGTNVLVDLYFEPPGRMVGAAIGHFLKGLEKAILNQNLRNLKAYMETGEVPTNRRQKPNGRALEGSL